jgi:hypothetical protein
MYAIWQNQINCEMYAIWQNQINCDFGVRRVAPGTPDPQPRKVLNVNKSSLVTLHQFSLNAPSLP